MLAMEANDEWLGRRGYIAKHSVGPVLEERPHRAQPVEVLELRAAWDTNHNNDDVSANLLDNNDLGDVTHASAALNGPRGVAGRPMERRTAANRVAGHSQPAPARAMKVCRVRGRSTLGRHSDPNRAGNEDSVFRAARENSVRTNAPPDPSDTSERAHRTADFAARGRI
jgi:hypothetical protein